MNGDHFSWITVLFAVCLFSSSPALTQDSEGEPNQPCTGAQVINADFGSLPLAVVGNLAPVLDTAPAGDVDFYLFEGPPGMLVRAWVVSEQNDMGWVFDPYLGLFDGACNLLDWNDWNVSMFPVINFAVPDDGFFILAVTGSYDSEFIGDHFQEGPYTLRLIQPPEPIGAITGQVIDSVTGMPLAGNAPPWPEVNIFRCIADFCGHWENFRTPDENGMFYVDSRYDGSPLDPGRFRVLATAASYQPAEIGPFVAASDEVIDLGLIELIPPPFVFENIVPCAEIPGEGGSCEFSADVRNNTADVVRGQAWSLVRAEGLLSPAGWTWFQPEKASNIQIKPFSARTVRFRFDVPGGVAREWFYVCAEGWFADRAKGYFGTVLNQNLFCTNSPYGPLVQSNSTQNMNLMRTRQGFPPAPPERHPNR